jgi:beta-barrel assembly-enhancing protease
MRSVQVIIAIIIAIASVVGYFMRTEKNPVTGEKQHIDISVEQEIALGLQAAPEMANQYGGLHPDEKVQAYVKQVGESIVASTDASKAPYDYDFHVLADDQTVNAFALPGGQIFITSGLLKKLSTEDQLAGVLGHEIGHVVGRHSAEHMAQARLTEGLTGAAVLATYDPNDPASQGSAAVAMLIGNLVNMKFGREDELESDRIGVEYMVNTGYKPEAMIEVMKILEEAGGGGGQVEFFSTHPNPENRISEIQDAIEKYSKKKEPAGTY